MKSLVNHRQLWLVLLFLPFTVSAQLKVANVFSDHLVLQRDKPVKIWGTAASGAKVLVTFMDKTAQAATDNSGKWTVVLGSFAANKNPQTITVNSDNQEIIMKDVLVGDVWLCTGQSNMEWVLRDTDNAETEIKQANFPTIRQLKIQHDLAFQPKTDVLETKWEVATPKTVPEFTAIGYYFAKRLQRDLDVPIGLINSSWGGSHIETWISETAMKDSDVLKYYVATMPRSWEEDARQNEQKLITRIYGNVATDVTKINENDYQNSTYDFIKWLDINVPGQWQWSGLPAFLGTAFLQKSIDVPASFVKQVTGFSFGSNSGNVEIMVNGKMVFKGVGLGKITTKLPAGTWKNGTNSVLIKVSKNNDNGWEWMGFGGENKDFYVEAGAEKVMLVEQPWKLMPSWKNARTYSHWMNNAGTIAYNAMIAPLTDYAIKGAIWYQGESNAGRAKQYQKSFPLMINNWRQDWGYDFPFLFVQLSSYGGFQDSNAGSNWAELREAQTMTLQLPKTGMAVTTDIGNPDNIHPRNKLDVGNRLALSALKVAYGKDLVYSGPTYKDVTFTQGKALLSFENVGSGLLVENKYGYLQGFEIAGSDQKFYYAKAEIQGDKVVVSHPAVKNPKAVRYSWTESPVDANLFNNEGLPASPFRTDTWKGITENGTF